MDRLNLLSMAFAGALVLCACKQEPAYKISGTVEIPVFEGAKVYLGLGDNLANLPVDSTVVKGGRYEFRGMVTRPDYGHIIMLHPEDEQKSVYVSLALENVDIAVRTDAEGWTVVKGTPDNETYQQYLEVRRDLERKLNEAAESFKAKEKAAAFAVGEELELQVKWGEQLAALQRMEYDWTLRNINNPAFWGNLYNVGMGTSLDGQKALVAAANERTLATSAMQSIAERIAIQERTAIGQPYVDFCMTDPEGNPVALSDYVDKGKYILIDFWASWCGPCRAEMPNVLKAYNRYKDKRFDVVGVSLDSNRDQWLKAIEEEGIPWIQVSDLKGWESAGAKAYAVRSIPHTVLLDPQGKIIARGIRGEGLHKKLAELLDK